MHIDGDFPQVIILAVHESSPTADGDNSVDMFLGLVAALASPDLICPASFAEGFEVVELPVVDQVDEQVVRLVQWCD